MKNSIIGASVAIGLALSAGAAQAAAIVSGSIWFVPAAIAQNAIPANVPATIPDVTFLAPSDPLSFDSRTAGGPTLGDFLATGGAFGVVENTAGGLARTAVDTLWKFEGFVTVTNGQTFSVAHDDGLTLIIGGLDLGFNPTPTPPVVSVATYSGPSGNLPFTLIYGECCGYPAVLLVELPFETPNVVPAPAALLVFGSTLAGLAVMRRRRIA